MMVINLIISSMNLTQDAGSSKGTPHRGHRLTRACDNSSLQRASMGQESERGETGGKTLRVQAKYVHEAALI